jgi:hypothetical protein
MKERADKMWLIAMNTHVPFDKNLMPIKYLNPHIQPDSQTLLQPKIENRIVKMFQL